MSEKRCKRSFGRETYVAKISFPFTDNFHLLLDVLVEISHFDLVLVLGVSVLLALELGSARWGPVLEGEEEPRRASNVANVVNDPGENGENEEVHPIK